MLPLSNTGVDAMTRSWIGGLRERANATWPMCRLRLDQGGICLEPSAAWLGWLVPTYRVPWSSVARASPAQGVFGSGGVRFQLKDPVQAQRRHGLAKLWPASARHPLFWCSIKQRDAILAAVPDRSLVQGGLPPR
jgi:hypothetical protein